MLFEVYDGGLVIRSDDRVLTVARRWLNIVGMALLQPFRFLATLPFLRRAQSASFTVPWRDVDSVRHDGGRQLTVQLRQGVTRTFQFRSKRALRAVIDQLDERGLRIASSNA
ncbi:MAG: hypothetical protein ACYCST_09270 [Acidimicrobiales bacterium]